MDAQTVEEVLAQASKYGYHVNMQNGNQTWYGLYHDRFGIHMDLYPTTEEFQLVKMEGFIQITTGKCGSFMREDHFLGIQRKFIELLVMIEKGRRTLYG